MKENILNALATARSALNNVAVREEQNCLNLGGAMQILREVLQTLEKCDIIPQEGTQEGGCDNECLQRHPLP